MTEMIDTMIVLVTGILGSLICLVGMAYGINYIFRRFPKIGHFLDPNNQVFVELLKEKKNGKI